MTASLLAQLLDSPLGLEWIGLLAIRSTAEGGASVGVDAVSGCEFAPNMNGWRVRQTGACLKGVG